ncbi:MAG: GNAT family N-acetyltransferase [Ardenticatenaceae bacterium]|nr:GNAT family N-acetyltransferase [Ardenticatenaceae bacterium]MCB8991022.1 GNAT family N-acetyltransferase [Ardenticatenaceae bacterium]
MQNPPPFDPQSVILEGQVVRLEPLSLDHVSDLLVHAQDEDIWRYLPYGLLNSEARLAAHVRSLLQKQVGGSEIPFAVIYRESGQAVGMTRYMDIRRAHRSLEIGGTWYGVAYQRTAVNTESKYLLLRHAFEVLGCIRVQIKTDARNLRSQRAIERIGAVREGLLRQHVIMPDGYLRDTIYYSILDKEWPHVKEARGWS